MRFSADFIERIKDNIILSELIAKRTKLERRGREYIGICPFHQEKSPSFTVNDQKRFFHCFGCAQHGDAIKYISLIHSMSFFESVEYLAKQLNINIDASYDHQTQHYEYYYKIMQYVANWFHQQLKNNNQALNYLYSRQIDDKTIDKFLIGYAPADNFISKEQLSRLKLSEKSLIDLGILIKIDDRPSYNKFRNRIIFPIIDRKNKIIGFGGRVINQSQPKYLNSPQTLLFKKGEILYNENYAKLGSKLKEQLIVVEGYMDAITLTQFGYDEVVAILGTALTEFNLQNLWKLNNEPIICFDADEAGNRAMNKLAYEAISFLKPNYSLRFLKLPKGNDPDDLIKSRGKGFFDQLIKNSQPLSELIWANEFALLGTNYTPEQQANLENKLMLITNQIQNKIVKNSYRNFFMQQIWNQLKKKKKPQLGSTNNIRLNSEANFGLSVIEQIERLLIFTIINEPKLLDDFDILEEFISIELSSKQLEQIRNIILELKANDSEFFDKKIMTHLENQGLFTDIIKGFELYSNNILKKANYQELWYNSLTRYQISTLEVEYREALNELTDNSMLKASELQKQIIILKEKLNDSLY